VSWIVDDRYLHFRDRVYAALHIDRPSAQPS
jgi:hypothetical protein